MEVGCSASLEPAEVAEGAAGDVVLGWSVSGATAGVGSGGELG